MVKSEQIVNLALIAGALLFLNKLKGAMSDDTEALKCEGKKSYSPGVYDVFASDIYQAIYKTVFYEDEAAIIRTLKKLNTDADACELVKAYGIRSAFWSVPRSLVYTLDDYLSDADKEEVNAHFRAKGITYIRLST